MEENKKALGLLQMVCDKFPEASSEYLNCEIVDFNECGFSIDKFNVEDWLDGYQKNIDVLDYTEEEYIIKKVNKLLEFYKEVTAGLQKNGLTIDRFQHLDSFAEWLKTYSNYKVDSDYVVVSIVELVKKYEATGFSVFELSKAERANQNIFDFSYEVEPAEFDDGELIKDEVFIF